MSDYYYQHRKTQLSKYTMSRSKVNEYFFPIEIIHSYVLHVVQNDICINTTNRGQASENGGLFPKSVIQTIKIGTVARIAQTTSPEIINAGEIIINHQWCGQNQGFAMILTDNECQ